MASYEIDNNINNVVITEEPAEEVTPNYNTPAPTGNGGEAKSDMVGQLKKGSALDWAPTTFVSFGKVNRTTTAELASKIHAAFGATFHDLLGAAINIDPKGNFKLELLFEQNTEKCPSGKITNLVGLTCATGANSFFAKNQIIQNRVNNKAYTLNAETKMLLAEFMCGGAKANKYTDAKKWDSHISQVPIPVSAYRDPYYRG
jgi:flavodoxin